MSAFTTALLFMWVSVLLTWALVNRGIPVFQDLARDMSRFFMEKALGPGADLVEGRPGSGSRAWMFHGMLWFCIAATFGFIELWLAHEPTALHTLSTIGYAPTTDQMSSAVGLLSYNAIWMMLVGASLHINARLSGSGIASESNAALVSYLYSGGIMLGLIGSHISGDWGDYMLTAAGITYLLANVAVAVNHLLTMGERGDSPIQPSQWLIVFSLIIPLLGCLGSLLGVSNDSVYHSTVTFGMVAMALAVAHYVIPSKAGAPLWSRTLSGVTIFGLLFFITPFKMFDADLGQGTAGLLTVLYTLSLIPIFAAVTNLVRTAGIHWDSSSSSSSASITLAGVVLFIPVAVGTLFIGVDAISLENELGHLIDPMTHLITWGPLGMIALGGVMACFPAATGRELFSASSTRNSFWLAGIGVLLSVMAYFSAALVDGALSEAEVTSDASEPMLILASISFYLVSIAGIMLMLNMIKGVTRGTPITSDDSGPAVTADRMTLTPGSTSIRSLMSAGAGVDTEIAVICDRCEEEE